MTVSRRLVDRLLLVGLGLALAANALVLFWPSDHDRTASAREEAAASVAARLPALLEYGSANPEDDLLVAAANVTDRYRPQIEALLRQSISLIPAGVDLRNDVEVDRVAVVDSAPDRVRLLVLIHQVRSNDGIAQDPQKGRLVLDVVAVEGEWLIDSMSPV